MVVSLYSIVAWAGDPTPALVHMSATPVEAGDGELSLDGFVTTPASYGGVSVLFAPADRVALRGQLFATECEDCEVPGQRSQLGVAWDLTTGDTFNFAPTLQVSAGTSVQDMGWDIEIWEDSSARESSSEIVLMPGLALEGGSKHLRYDLSASLPVWLMRPGEAYTQEELLLAWAGEAGLTARLGKEEHHALRLGTTSILPSVSYRYEGGPFFVEAGVVLGGARAQLGVRPYKRPES
jgi:hypothetical protein